MVRVRDAQEGRKEATRLAMMNVWDAKISAPEGLQEGQRHMVSVIDLGAGLMLKNVDH